MTSEQPDDFATRCLAAILPELGARAAGLWKVVGGSLEQLAFVASPALSPEVARGFAEATQAIALTQSDLGVVRAATTGTVTVSRSEELSEDSGSGYWLRAFGATRSVAVPLLDVAGEVRAVVSAALAGDSRLADSAVAEQLRAAMRGWASPS